MWGAARSTDSGTEFGIKRGTDRGVEENVQITPAVLFPDWFVNSTFTDLATALVPFWTDLVFLRGVNANWQVGSDCSAIRISNQAAFLGLDTAYCIQFQAKAPDYSGPHDH